jgi:hypothetical protein
MSRRTLLSMLIAALWVSTTLYGQTARPWKTPRTADGQPDLQGTWTTSTLTTLERPAEFAGKPTLTEQEAKEYEARLLRDGNRDRRGATPELDVGGAYNEFLVRSGRTYRREPADIVDHRSA